MRGREEIEVVAVERLAALQVTVATGQSMDGIYGDIVVVEQHAHPRVIAHESTVSEVIVWGVITIVGLAVEYVFLKIPIAKLVEGADRRRGIVAVIENLPVVIVLHDEPLEDKREVEVTRNDALTLGHDIGNTTVEGVQAHDATLTANGIGNFYLLVPRYPSKWRNGDVLKRISILNTDVGIELSVECPEIDSLFGRQRNIIMLAIHVKTHLRCRHWPDSIIFDGGTCCKSAYRDTQQKD